MESDKYYCTSSYAVADPDGGGAKIFVFLTYFMQMMKKNS